MHLPCLAGTCAADNARKRLAEGVPDAERAELEEQAKGCDGETPDPWTPSLVWAGCPGKLAMRRQDVDAALTLRGLATMGPLTGWPDGWAAWVVSTWTEIEAERRAFEAARRASRG